ncbi:hypothetical protein, partial [Citrobacter koseri]|uniref:hypothetical protein n=1 Tax=Citrobacter koseri TaxID=545 RepID=UPI001A91138B
STCRQFKNTRHPSSRIFVGFLAYPGRVLDVRFRGFNEGHPCPSPEATFGCSNSFLTNLSLRRRLDATRMI